VGRSEQQQLNIQTLDDLITSPVTKPDWLVERLLLKKSANILIGDSTIGKTPLALQLALCVAAGVPFFHHLTTQGPVLYLDAETSHSGFVLMLKRLKGFLKLPDDRTIPFYAYSPNFQPPEPYETVEQMLGRKIEEIKPALVVIDCLRPWFPLAEQKGEEVVKMLRWQRHFCQTYGTTFVTIHHRRKNHQGDDKPSLEHGAMEWLKESAGSFALINQTDTRWGVEVDADTDELTWSGTVRGFGVIQPFHFQREFDEDEGEPIGFKVIADFDRLPELFKQVYTQLPGEFRYKDVLAVFGGKNKRQAGEFLRTVESVGYLKRVMEDGYNRVRYVKVEP